MTAQKNIGFYQVCFSSEQMAGVHEPAIAYDNLANPHPEQREFYIFNEIFESGLYLRHDLTGAVSAKFESKAKRSPKQFIDWVTDNPGYDLYMINPFPQNRYFFHDLWQQGEYCHAGIIEIAQHVFSNVFGDSLKTANFPRVGSNSWSYCNFWVGSATFWEAYIPLLKRIFDFCIHDQKFHYFDNANHLPAPAPMFSFVIERFLSTVLVNRDLFPEMEGLRVLAYDGYSHEEIPGQCDNEFDARLFLELKRLEPVIEIASAAPSVRLQQAIHMQIFKFARRVVSWKLDRNL